MSVEEPLTEYQEPLTEYQEPLTEYRAESANPPNRKSGRVPRKRKIFEKHFEKHFIEPASQTRNVVHDKRSSESQSATTTQNQPSLDAISDSDVKMRRESFTSDFAYLSELLRTRLHLYSVKGHSCLLDADQIRVLFISKDEVPIIRAGIAIDTSLRVRAWRKGKLYPEADMKAVFGKDVTCTSWQALVGFLKSMSYYANHSQWWNDKVSSKRNPHEVCLINIKYLW